MKIYQNTIQLDLSEDAIDAAIQYGIFFSLSAQASNKERSHYYNYFYLFISGYGQPIYNFGYSKKNVFMTLGKHETLIGCFKIDSNYPLGYKKLK